MRPPRMPNAALAAVLVALATGPDAACSGSDGDRGSTPEEPGDRPPGGADRGTTQPAPADPPATEPGSREPVAEPPAVRPRVWLEPPGRDPVAVDVEIARTPAQTQRGLMFRRQMDANAGMIFLFARPRQMTFWMRNTYIPLDMVFITTDMRVLGVVENATPETDDAREVPGISQYVLEVNAGFAREHGITAGTMVRFENVGDLPQADDHDDEDEDDDDWEDDE